MPLGDLLLSLTWLLVSHTWLIGPITWSLDHITWSLDLITWSLVNTYPWLGQSYIGPISQFPCSPSHPLFLHRVRINLTFAKDGSKLLILADQTWSHVFQNILSVLTSFMVLPTSLMRWMFLSIALVEHRFSASHKPRWWPSCLWIERTWYCVLVVHAAGTAEATRYHSAC